MGVRLSVHVNGVPTVPTNHDADIVTLQHKSLKDAGKDNPSQLGDPVSLKAETSKSDLDRPTSGSGGNKTSGHEREQVFSKSAPTPTEGDVGTGGDEGLSLKERAEQKLKSNPSALGDPVSFKAETSDNEPTDQDRGARSGSGKPKM